MNVVVTGAAGFLGDRIVDALLEKNSLLPVKHLLLTDTVKPRSRADPRVSTLALDLATPAAAESLLAADTDVLFHLAAIVSGHAETDFDLGLRVNFDATRALLDTARRIVPRLRFVFTSTVGVFGGDLPTVVDDLTSVTPQNSYGTAKAMSELLLNDYARRGYVDARLVRLPTVSVRGGAPNRAVTSFASGVVREPLNGERSVCPVPSEQKLWLTSPSTVVHNIIYAATIPAEVFGPWRGVNLPGICVTVYDMVNALREIAGEQVAAFVNYEPDESIAQIVASFPSKFDNTRALRLGFIVDKNFHEIIRAYIKNDLKR
ncbi:D-erythronate dehydrogenase-like [Epargyreus clarus]|uniref:D-erythronate dehydrogenase-like n=1 Tax=Epargyreus clarus TaxID=520877 RepID=UPI003C2B9BF6